MASTNTWADTPFSLIETPSKNAEDVSHPAIKIATEMAISHNMFLRGLNSVYLQGPLISEPKDVADLFLFCNIWITSIELHHDIEENHLFKDLEKMTRDSQVVSREREQHRVIHEGLDRFEKYVKETKPEAYKWTELSSILDSFGSVLKTHLSEEVETLSNLKHTGLTGEELTKIWEATEEVAQKEIKRSNMMETIVPMVLGCTDKTFEGGMHTNFPPVPFFVPYLCHYWYGRTHQGAWRFNPCDMWCQPRPLQFLKDEK